MYKILSSKLYFNVQVCIQIKGFQFPKHLAEDWIESEDKSNNSDHTDIFRYVEQGVKLGL